MNSLLIRRLVVWAVSALLGFVVTYLIITVLLPAVSPSPMPISLERYGFGYFIVTYIPLVLIFVTWLDAFMGTRILPD